MIVVDLGCCTRAGDDSVRPLIRRYKPDVLYGFDPGAKDRTEFINGTRCEFRAMAAWTYYGTIEMGVGSGQHLCDTLVRDYGYGGPWQRVDQVPCFNFADWLDALEEPAVVKMNIEGGEFDLLEHVLDRDADWNVLEWLIAWHDGRLPAEYSERRKAIEARLRAPAKSWGPEDLL